MVAGIEEVEQGGAGVADMQQPGRARCEARTNGHEPAPYHETLFADRGRRYGSVAGVRRLTLLFLKKKKQKDFYSVVGIPSGPAVFPLKG
ncbi:hypothetical protein GLI01_34220 [Gluconacetobacter liquefaciens]|nr:hypothetical protein GLI01_34220 [Gluconacetobacter liquefaciens]